MSAQRFLANNRNVLLSAVMSASSVMPIANAVIERPVARKGSARVGVSGTYVGQEEAGYEVEIIDVIVETPLISQPVFAGAGTGSISGIAFAGTAQTFTVTLADLGQVITTAGTDLEGVSIVARAPGAAGNLIHFSVDASTLAFAATDYSVLDDTLKAGSDVVTGPQWDWDTKTMGPDGMIPLDAHRIAFGEDPAVYRQYKTYKDGAWAYHFEPALVRDVASGTPVKSVTGGRTVTITDGTVTETYAGIVTLYDLLSAIQTGSVLVKVTGVVANDRTPGGMAARDMQTRTDAHALPSYGSGSTYAKGFTAVTVGANASTELVLARCWANSSATSLAAGLGRELWELTGSVSGALGNIQTAVPYEHPAGKFGLTIPRKVPDGYGQQRGRFTQGETRYVARTADEIEPPICVASMALGPAAVDQSITLVWTARPVQCLCEDMPAPDLSGAVCLTGIIGGTTTMGYSAEAVAKLTAMYDWSAGIIADNSYYLRGLASPEFFIPDLRKAMTDFERVLAKVDGNTAGMTAWDTALVDFKADVETGLGNVGEMAVQSAVIDPATYPIRRGQYVAEATAGFIMRAPNSKGADGYALQYGMPGDTVTWQPIGGAIISDRHQSRLDWVLITAGISPLGKSDPSTVDGGDGCWVDTGADHYWTVKGSVGGDYAPAFNGVPYFSSQGVPGAKGAYRSTHEFAFQVNVACEESLKVGDEVTLSIGDAGWPATYQIGDVLYLPLIGAQPLYLAGGQDGDNIQTWHVEGSIEGAMPAYALDTDAPAPYGAAGLAFEIAPGGIPFEAGDSFKFTVEGGHFRWRKDAGAWSASAPIPATDVTLSDGLSASFAPGAAPSFAAGDLYRFRAMQPSALSNVVRPDIDAWRWSGDSAVMTADLGGTKTIDCVALAFHSLPTGATATVYGSADGVSWDWSVPLTWRAGVMAALFADKAAAYLKLEIAGATDAAIGWAWAGQALATEHSADCLLRRDYAIERGAGINPSASYLGATRSGDIEWSNVAMSDTDISAILSMLDHVKANDDEAIILIPQHTRPEESWPVRVLLDEVDLPERSGYQPNSGVDRRYGLKLSVKGVVS